MAVEQEYVEELAQTVNMLFANDVTDPSTREIAEAHFPGLALGGEIIEGIRKRLHKICDVLEGDYGHPVVLVSRTYYSRFRKEKPKTMADAMRCHPIGYGKNQFGIYLPTDTEDLVYRAMLQSNRAQGAGKVKRNADRAVDAADGDRLTELQRTLPARPELAQRVLRPPPGPSHRRSPNDLAAIPTETGEEAE